MARANTVHGDLYVSGDISGVSFTIPSGTIANAAVSSAAQIDAEKCEQQYVPVKTYSSLETISTSAATFAVHRVDGTSAELVKLFAGAQTIPTNTITIDVLKNTATTVISTVNITSTSTAGVAEVSTTTATFSSGDVIHLKIYPASTTTSLGAGVFAGVKIRELE